MTTATVKVTLIKSMTGRIPNHKLCVKGLGLRRIGHTVEVLDTPENRGMINKARAEVRTSELAKVAGDVVTLQSLKDANVINQNIQRVKVMLSGEVGRAVTLKGIAATKGARAAIEAAGGKFEE